MFEHREPGSFQPATESLRPPSLTVEPIPPERVLDFLQLTDASRALRASVRGSHWASIDGGRMLIESRSLVHMVQPDPRRRIELYDVDDCLMSATGWHKKEYELVAQSDKLRAKGIEISVEEAKALYELSKITIPGVAEREPRYTPVLNMVLLSRFADAKRNARMTDENLAKPWEELQYWSDSIRSQIDALGERALSAYAIDPDIRKLFMDNAPGDFLYADFVDSILGGTHRHDLRIIATRGKIEGPLGQVYKVHASGLMKQRSVGGPGIDLAIYSNDIKAEALTTLFDFLGNIQGRHIRIYDDNPNEILPYLGVIKNLGAPNIEVIQVSHPDAKRKDLQVDATPNLDYQSGSTRLRHYSLVSIPVSSN